MYNSPKCKIYPLTPWDFEVLNCVATLSVTYIDGTSETFKNVRYKEKVMDPDPVKVDGSTVTVETKEMNGKDRIITILNVRWFEFL